MMQTLPIGLLVLLVAILPAVTADPATLPFTDCFDEEESLPQKFNVTNVYAQVLHNDGMGHYLNLTVLGSSPKEILGLTNTSSSLSTLFTSTSVLTLNAWTNSSYLCQTMRPPSPLPEVNSTDHTFCPVAPGPFAFSTSIPWGNNRDLTTLITRLRAVDPFGKELLCLDLNTTPVSPRPSSPYGKAEVIFWATVALAIAYWIVVGLARISSAWNRGVSRHGRGIWSKAQSAGYILASAISGERFATTPALMRYCTPSMRDVIFHTQWCAVLAMVAVEWPQFVYPLLTQTAWATLSFNVSLTDPSQFHRWDPLSVLPFSPPTGFADQFADPTSPLFIDSSVPNRLYTLPDTATDGISSFAYTIGLRPQDLFPTCLILFLGIIAGTIAVSVLIWFIDYVISVAGEAIGGTSSYNSNLNRMTRTRSPAFGTSKELPETSNMANLEESKSLTGSNTGPLSGGRFSNGKFSLGPAGMTSERGGISSHRSWWRLRSDIGAFHGSVLHGNLVRILILFHLPVTIFSIYQMTSSRSQVSTSSVVLAALSFVVFSILIPAHLVIRVTLTTTNKLYDETKTLLSLGPLYNHYRHGSQLFATLFFATNIGFGITIGAGQRSGTAQAIIILVIEVVSALVTSIWLPWGSGASMGLISFLFCVARIVIAVLLVILTQAISIGAGPGGWVTYGILIILAIVYLALLLMLIVKIIEGVVRLFGGVGFDRSRNSVDTGLIGACGLLGCFGIRRRRHSRKRSRRQRLNNLNPAMATTRDSDLSSYMPPANGPFPTDGNATPPRFIGTGSRKGSTHSQPPSVLKPEHANRPYLEDPVDADDDGNIMGAWQPFAKSLGYTPSSENSALMTPSSAFSGVFPQRQQPSSPAPAAGSSGFSRVGGGRAHIDTPYAIASGSSHAFPSIGQQSQLQPPQPPSANRSTSALATSLPFMPSDSREDIQLSLANIETGTAISAHNEPGITSLPPGAMQPAHIRTKSQTAIVEDFLPSNTSSSQNIIRQYQQQLQPLQRYTHVSEDSYLRPDAFGPAPHSAPPDHKFTLNADDESGDEQDQQKKKKWYHLRRNRAHSSEGRTSAGPSSADLATMAGGNIDPELGGLGSNPSSQTQRSFVVIRKGQNSTTRLGQGSSSASAADSGQAGAGTPSTYPKASSRPPTR